MRIGESTINLIIQTGQNHDLHFKDQFHRYAKQYLKDIAVNMGLGTNEYEIRSNKGGPGVLGEVILHTDHLYVCMGGSVSWGDKSFYYRTCKGRKDYTGGVNTFMKYKDLENPENVARIFSSHSKRAI